MEMIRKNREERTKDDLSDDKKRVRQKEEISKPSINIQVKDNKT